jgi:phosphate starvation-inducible PhoH-like protein
LSEAVSLLSRVEGIGHVIFREGDVVRHDLVRRIVGAYEAAARARRPDAHELARTRRGSS